MATTKDIDDSPPHGAEEVGEEEEERRSPTEFRVLLRGGEDLENRLIEFKNACEAHEKHTRRHRKRRYYNLGLVAKLVSETTLEEMRRMLVNGCYTYHVDAVAYRPDELQRILECMNIAIASYSADQETRVVTSLALEVNGECCRIGRLRNNCTTMMMRGAVVTLTTNAEYRYCGFKEICFVINLQCYLSAIKLGDMISIGREARCRVVKCLSDCIAVLVIDPGLLASYDYIELPNQCHVLKPDMYPDLYKIDLALVASLQANYVVLPKIRCKGFLRAFRRYLKEEHKDIKLIGMIDFEYVRTNMLDLLGIIKLLDYLWIPDMFNVNCCVYDYIMEDVLPIAFCQEKPVMGTVPLERCSDFKRFENHEFLNKIDAIHMQKSPWCNKYPLIVKKLMPVRDFRMGIVQNQMVLKNILTSYQSVVNFVIRTISTVECQAIFLYTSCKVASVALSRTEVYPPVFLMMPLDEEDDEETVQSKLDLIRSLHLRRNMKPILYTKSANFCGYSPIEYGIDYMRRTNGVAVGDFVVSLEVAKEDTDNVTIGIGEDVVILRAFYVQPMNMCEKFKYS